MLKCGERIYCIKDRYNSDRKVITNSAGLSYKAWEVYENTIYVTCNFFDYREVYFLDNGKNDEVFKFSNHFISENECRLLKLERLKKICNED